MVLVIQRRLVSRESIYDWKTERPMRQSTMKSFFLLNNIREHTEGYSSLDDHMHIILDGHMSRAGWAMLQKWRRRKLNFYSLWPILFISYKLSKQHSISSLKNQPF